MNKICMVAAIGTPMTLDEQLHSEGLVAQLDRLGEANVSGILVAGTFGVMQMLRDDTYCDLVTQACGYGRFGGKLFIGVSDMSSIRTKQRIHFVNQFCIDGVVVLPPFFMAFSQQEILDYYRSLADESKAPVYLYDLPQRTHVAINPQTVLALAQHPNIAGIKCSGPVAQALNLIEQVTELGLDFEVLLAHPDRLVELAENGVRSHLDGIYALAPHWAMQVARGVTMGRSVHEVQNDLTQLRDVLRRHGGLSALTPLMNACGIPGRFSPAPFQTLSVQQQRDLFNEPVVKKLLATESLAVSAV